MATSSRAKTQAASLRCVFAVAALPAAAFLLAALPSDLLRPHGAQHAGQNSAARGQIKGHARWVRPRPRAAQRGPRSTRVPGTRAAISSPPPPPLGCSTQAQKAPQPPRTSEKVRPPRLYREACPLSPCPSHCSPAPFCCACPAAGRRQSGRQSGRQTVGAPPVVPTARRLQTVSLLFTHARIIPTETRHGRRPPATPTRGRNPTSRARHHASPLPGATMLPSLIYSMPPA